MPRLVDNLRGLEQLRILPFHVLDQLAAHQHGAVLVGHQGREAPSADMSVELNLLRLGQAIPEPRPVNIDEVIGDKPAISHERRSPVDVGRSVPLIDRRLLVEAPHVGLLAIVDMAEICNVVDVDVMPTLHALPPGSQSPPR